MIPYPAKGGAGVDHVVHEQHFAVQGTTGDSDVLRDVHLPLHGACGFPITARGENPKRHVVNSRKHITYPYAAARKAKNLVELPAGFMNGQSKLLYQLMIIGPGNPMITVGVSGRAHGADPPSSLERLVQ